jgi:acetyl esterase/lipase
MLNYRKWPLKSWPKTEWKFDKTDYKTFDYTQWMSKDWMSSGMNTWVNNWVKDSWGKDDIWQNLDANLNTSANAYTLRENVYGAKPWQKLDVFTPLDNKDEKKPVLVFFYGGGWHDGTKEKYRYVAKTFTDLGYVVVIPDYVKYPTGRFPDFIYDGAEALAWVKKHIEAYGGDTQNIVLSGHSAGAHLGALLATDPRYLETVGMTKKDIKAFVGLAGPYDFKPLIKRYADVFDDASLHPDICCSSFVDGSEPPMLLAQAGADMIVGSYTNDPLIKALGQKSVPLETQTYTGMGHMAIVLALSPMYSQDKTVINHMHEFFQRHIQPAK